MEAIEESEPNVLRELASDEELTQIPRELTRRINAHFNAKFEEFITAKAVFETSRKCLGKHGLRRFSDRSRTFRYALEEHTFYLCAVETPRCFLHTPFDLGIFQRHFRYPFEILCESQSTIFDGVEIYPKIK